MNIFILDTDIKKCAEYHLDKHCVKMILETTQLLNNARIKHNPSVAPIYYFPTKKI
jgi:deoxyribose-phosphate aldolase